MSYSKRSNVVFMAVVSIVAIFGAAACQPSESSGANPNQVFVDEEEDSDSEEVKGAICEGYEKKALFTKTGTFEERVRAELEVEIERYEKNVKLVGTPKIECTTNGRAQTYYQCSAYEAFKTKNNWVTKEVLSSELSQPGVTNDAARSDLQKIVDEMKAANTVFRNESIGEVPLRERSRHDSQTGLAVWKLTYQVPGCK